MAFINRFLKRHINVKAMFFKRLNGSYLPSILNKVYGNSFTII